MRKISPFIHVPSSRVYKVNSPQQTYTPTITKARLIERSPGSTTYIQRQIAVQRRRHDKRSRTSPSIRYIEKRTPDLKRVTFLFLWRRCWRRPIYRERYGVRRSSVKRPVTPIIRLVASKAQAAALSRHEGRTSSSSTSSSSPSTVEQRSHRMRSADIPRFFRHIHIHGLGWCSTAGSNCAVISSYYYEIRE